MKQMERREIRVATITVSDTRTSATDTGGELLRKLLGTAGFTVTTHVIVPDEPSALRAAIDEAIGTADAVVTTGGTGLGPRDQTYEVIVSLLDKPMDGFGEAFRRLSWDTIGPRAILSRAIAGVYRQRVVVALPGSPAGVELGVTDIVAPVLVHAVAVATGRAGQHAPKQPS